MQLVLIVNILDDHLKLLYQLHYMLQDDIFFFWKSLHTCIFSWYANIVLAFVGLEQFIGSGSLLPTVLILLEYGFAIASSTYCLTFFFSEHSMAQVQFFKSFHDIVK